MSQCTSSLTFLLPCTFGELSVQKYMTNAVAIDICKCLDFITSMSHGCFTVRVPSLFCFMPIPVLRSMLSKVVLPGEQGK